MAVVHPVAGSEDEESTGAAASPSEAPRETPAVEISEAGDKDGFAAPEEAPEIPDSLVEKNQTEPVDNEDLEREEPVVAFRDLAPFSAPPSALLIPGEESETNEVESENREEGGDRETEEPVSSEPTAAVETEVRSEPDLAGSSAELVDSDDAGAPVGGVTGLMPLGDAISVENDDREPSPPQGEASETDGGGSLIAECKDGADAGETDVDEVSPTSLSEPSEAVVPPSLGEGDDDSGVIAEAADESPSPAPVIESDVIEGELDDAVVQSDDEVSSIARELIGLSAPERQDDQQETDDFTESSEIEAGSDKAVDGEVGRVEGRRDDADAERGEEDSDAGTERSDEVLPVADEASDRDENDDAPIHTAPVDDEFEPTAPPTSFTDFIRSPAARGSSFAKPAPANFEAQDSGRADTTGESDSTASAEPVLGSSSPYDIFSRSARAEEPSEPGGSENSEDAVAPPDGGDLEGDSPPQPAGEPVSASTAPSSDSNAVDAEQKTVRETGGSSLVGTGGDAAPEAESLEIEPDPVSDEPLADLGALPARDLYSDNDDAVKAGGEEPGSGETLPPIASENAGPDDERPLKPPPSLPPLEPLAPRASEIPVTDRDGHGQEEATVDDLSTASEVDEERDEPAEVDVSAASGGLLDEGASASTADSPPPELADSSELDVEDLTPDEIWEREALLHESSPPASPAEPEPLDLPARDSLIGDKSGLVLGPGFVTGEPEQTEDAEPGSEAEPPGLMRDRSGEVHDDPPALGHHELPPLDHGATGSPFRAAPHPDEPAPPSESNLPPRAFLDSPFLQTENEPIHELDRDEPLVSFDDAIDSIDPYVGEKPAPGSLLPPPKTAADEEREPSGDSAEQKAGGFVPSQPELVDQSLPELEKPNLVPPLDFSPPPLAPPVEDGPSGQPPVTDKIEVIGETPEKTRAPEAEASFTDNFTARLEEKKGASGGTATVQRSHVSSKKPAASPARQKSKKKVGSFAIWLLV